MKTIATPATSYAAVLGSLAAAGGITRSVEMAQFTLRSGAALKGLSHFIPRTEVRSSEAGHWALFGRQ